METGKFINPANICNLALLVDGRAPVLNEKKGLTFQGMVDIVSAVTGKEFTGKEPLSELQKWGGAALEVLKNFPNTVKFVLFPKGILDGTVDCEVSQKDEFIWYT